MLRSVRVVGEASVSTGCAHKKKKGGLQATRPSERSRRYLLSRFWHYHWPCKLNVRVRNGYACFLAGGIPGMSVGPCGVRRNIMKSKWLWHLIKVARHFSISTGQLRRSHALHSQPINLVVFQGSSDRVNETLSWGWLHAYMLSAFITTVHSYPAMPLA